MLNHLRITVFVALALWIPQIAAAAPGDFRVLHHQAVQIQSQRQVGAAERVTFDAYGRRFELSLLPNERIRRAMSANNTATVPLEGTVEGAAKSWVRMTRSPSGWRGMIYDGQDLYAVEPASDVAGATVEPLTVSGSSPVVYRLDDAVLPPEEMSCEIVQPDGSSTTASAGFNQLSRELHAQAATSELAASKQIRIGIVGDFEFVNQFASGMTTVEDAIVARMNIVDGIYTSQLGVKISLAPFTLFRTASDPFSKTKPSDLLSEMRNYRGSSSAQLALGLSHLMTGKDLDGDTVGIAYIGTVCDGSNASSLSEGRRTTTQSALIAAHEIGHNFGAPHDGETGACSSTPQTFLMAPRLNGSDQFSSCSIAQMQPFVNNGRCLTAYVPPDAGLEINSSSLQATVGTALVASFVVRAEGDDASNNVSVTATLPTNVTITSVTANGGSCTSGAGTASCTLGTLSSGDTRQIDMTLTPTASGSVNVSLALSSSNDANTSNNSGTITIAASGTQGPNPMPPPTSGGASNGGGGGGGRIDVALLAWLLATALLQLHRRGSPRRRLSASIERLRDRRRNIRGRQTSLI
jgi:hypothetical protein